MKNFPVLVSLLVLTACGGGSGDISNPTNIYENPSDIDNSDSTIIPDTPEVINDHITTNMITAATNEQEVRSAIVSYVGERLDGVYDTLVPNNAPRRNRAAVTDNKNSTMFNQQYEIALAKIQKMHETLHEMLNKTLEQLQAYISEHQQDVKEALKLYVDNDKFNALNWDSVNAEEVFNEQSVTQDSLDTFDENHDFKIIHQNIEDIDFIMHGDAVYDYRNMHFVVEDGKVKKITLETTVPLPEETRKIYMPDHVFQHKSDNSFDITHFIYQPILTGTEGSQWYDLIQNETINETKWVFESDKRLSLEEIKQKLKDKLSDFCTSCTEEKIAQFNEKIDSLTENEVRGTKGANPNDIAIGEKGLVGEMDLIMLGSDVGLQYSDFGYVEGNLAVYDAINGKENNSAYSVFSGGYNSKEIKNKPDEGSVFVGSAVADITKEIQNRTEKDGNVNVDISKSYMLTQTNDAKLEFKGGKEILYMNFSKSDKNPWYDMVVTSNSVNFDGDDSKIDKNFVLPDEAKTIIVENQNSYQIQDFTPRYFGDNGIQKEAISTSTINNDYDASESQHVRFTIDSAFGGKKQ